MDVLRHLIAGTLAPALAAVRPQRIGLLATIGTLANGLTRKVPERHSVPAVTTNLIELDTVGLPFVSTTEFRVLVSAVSVANVRRVARLMVVVVDRLTVVIVGDRTRTRLGIEALYPGVVSVPGAAVVAR